MRQSIHLDPKQVPDYLRGSYQGRKFEAVVCEEVTIPADAGLWSGGSRDRYGAIDFNSGEQRTLPGQQSAPWDNSRRDHVVKLQPGFAIVRHTFFCGKDHGLTFYVHPDNAVKLLPAPVELTPIEKMVLNATASLKSSYMGKDRYQMTVENMRYGTEAVPTRAAWDTAKQELVGKGMLNKAGAITVKGRNAL